jgi:hypothetical protein
MKKNDTSDNQSNGIVHNLRDSVYRHRQDPK